MTGALASGLIGIIRRKFMAKKSTRRPRRTLRGRDTKAVSAVDRKAGRAASAKRAVPVPRSGGAPKPFFPVVGVGASAGGLEAFTALLKALPADTGMSFVLVQHMDPTHESMLPRLLAKATPMPVHEVSDGMAVEPNHVYVIPSNAGMTISEGVLRLAARREGAGKNLRIDDFFYSLAEDLKSAAIGVILSGTASDGTLGLKAIKAEGGITFAQDEKTAKFPDMPLSAMATGCVDFSLPPQKIAAELARMGRHPYVRTFQQVEPPEGAKEESEGLRTICALLRTKTGVDFHLYKPATIQRRVARRMAVQRADALEHYIQLLHKNPAELDALYEDIFIHVTGFFRDPEALAALQQTVFARILHKEPGSHAIRVWVPGCSSGEEVYSIAMMLLEELGEQAGHTKIQIFGTDISDRAIEQARGGNYGESGMAQVSMERRRRFFVKAAGGWEIAKFVRDMCVFARHDVTKDPPFSRLDLISCRNVMIYFGPVAQKRVVETFHYALKPAGWLFLGMAEALNAFSHLFSVEDHKHKFFSRKPVAGPPYMGTTAAGLAKADQAQLGAASPLTRFDVRREAERVLLEQFAPAALVVDPDLQIVHFQGNTSPFLAPATGEPSFYLLRMVRPELVVDLRTAIQQVQKKGVAVRREGIRFKLNDAVSTVDLLVEPLPEQHAKGSDFLVVFQASPGPRQLESAPSQVKRQGGGKIARMEQELAATREHLRAIIEEQEAVQEEMKAANEEALSSNEELQSTNEELETAKEELQSSNEELTTLNDELQNRNTELGLLTNDLSNLLVGVEIPIVILDSDLRIRRFTPQAEKVLNLIASDVGRPLTDIASTLDVPNWKELISEVIEHHRVVHREVRDRMGRWYSLRMRPYKSGEDKIGGILMALLDIDTVKRSLDEAREARDFAEAIVETVREPLLILDAELRVLKATRSYYETFRTSAAQTEGYPLFDLDGGQWNVARLRESLEEVVRRDTRLDDFEVVHEFPPAGPRHLLLNARQIHRQSAGTPLILLAMEDVTERKQAENVLRQRDMAIQEASTQAILSVAADGRIVMANLRAVEMFGYSREELLELPLEVLLPARSPEAQAEHRNRYIAGAHNRPTALGLDMKGRRKDGTEFPVSVTLSHIETKDGTLGIDFITDLTERRQAEDALRLSQERLRLAQEAAEIGVWDWDIQGGQTRCSREWGPLYGLPPTDLALQQDAWLALIHPEDRARVQDEVTQSLEGTKVYNTEFRVVWPDGSIHWLLGRGDVIRDNRGNPVRMLGVNMDVTLRRQAQEERQALSARLAAAQEEERRRISRELHDDLTQRLAGLAMSLGGLAAEPPPSSNLKQQLRALQVGVVHAAEVARHVAHQLHPSELDDLGVVAALRALCEEFGRQQKIAVKFTSRGLPDKLNREIASCLYKVTQEGLRNISQHANARRVSVTLEGTGGRIRLRVVDTGVGFSVQLLGTTVGLGIQSMRERVRLVNGSFIIKSQPGEGTQISAEIPLSGVDE
jgi:two-component system CheB/CheR fusion protein